jgi:hypothetical protein
MIQRNWILASSSSLGRSLLRGAAEAALALGLLAWGNAISSPPGASTRDRGSAARWEVPAGEPVYTVEAVPDGDFPEGSAGRRGASREAPAPPAGRDALRGSLIDIWV